MIIERAIPVEPPANLAWAAPASRGGKWLDLALALWAYAAALLAVWMVMRYGGDRWSFATVMLMGLRWPYAAPLAALWPWALWSRRWRPALVAAAASWFVLFQVMGFRIALPASGPERGDLRLLTCNIHRQHVDPARLSEYIDSVRPDVVALQGWSRTGHEGLFAEPGWNTRREGELLIASRLPIEGVRPLTLAEADDVPPGQRGAAAVFRLRSSNGTIDLISLHLASPHAGLNAMADDGGGRLSASVARRWRESDALRAAADETAGPLVLAGDFNTTDDSPLFREHWSGFADAFLERGSGLGYTYINGHTQFRIDHILANSSWRIVRWSLGPDVGSPHRPLVADLCRQ